MKTGKRLFKGVLAFSVGVTTVIGSVLPMVQPVAAAEKEDSYTQYVDPFVCTDVDYGQLFPGSVVPNGLVKLSPDTYPHDGLDHAGYDYSKDKIQGFSHTRIEGVGGQGAGGDVLVTPTYVEFTGRPSGDARAMKYEKNDESAKPGYYSVKLKAKSGKDNNAKEDESLGKIHAEVTTDQRTGFHRYTFPKAGNVNIVTDLNYTYHGTDIRNATLDVLEQSDKTTAIGGRFSGRNVGGNGKYTMYFYMETSKPANSVKTWNGSKLSNEKHQKGNDLGSIMNFDVKDNEQIQLKVSISPISVEQAKVDMHNEINDWDFDATAKRADKAWNDVLSKVRVETSEVSDPTGDLKKLFYTHLYHMFMTPVNATSTTGTFRGTDGKIHEAKDYTHYDSWTLWDDYRKYPMIGLVQPDVYKDMVKSIADALDYGIVTWSHDKQPVPNVRTEHAVALLADGVSKGFTDMDNLEEAYEEAKKIANKEITSDVEKTGYFPNRVDRTAEYAYDDWCLSIIAKALGKEDEAQYFLERSMNYKNTFRKDAVDSPFSERKLGLLWNRNKEGEWANQDPSSGSTGLYQGTMWQYTWYDSNDVNGMMELMGGKQGMLEALMFMFGMQDENDPKGMQHNAANEVELHLPYLFNFVGRPDLTQHWVREIYTRKTWNSNYASGTQTEKQQMYKLSPQGYLETMDDDAGTMAMMFVSAAMGIFPMTPGDPTFQIGSPFFEKMTLDVGNGKTFTIEANGVSDKNEYIQSATLNGVDFNRTWLDYSEITRGGVLSLQMGDQPSDWAKDGVTAKSSSDMAPTSYSDDDEIQYSNGMFEESALNDGSIEEKIEITLKTNEFTGEINEDLTSAGKIMISNVPKGLTAYAVKTDKNKVEIGFRGKAENHALTNSISNMKIEISDEATATPINNSVRKVKDNIRIMFNDDSLNYSNTKFTEGKNDDGSIVTTSTITLSGKAVFAGNINDDLLKAGMATLTNVPEGLTPHIIKTGDKTAVLSFEGNAKKHDTDADVTLSFNDNAFVGAKAEQIQNSSCDGMTALVIDFENDYVAKLNKTINEAEYLKADAYTKTSYQALMDEVEKGKQLLKARNISDKEVDLAIGNILEAENNLKIPSDGFKQLEAENSDSWSGGDLRIENGNVLHGTSDGAWISYDGLDFSGLNPNFLEIRYDAASDRCPNDSTLEIRIDSVDGELAGKAALPNTGTGWGKFETLQVPIEHPELLSGTHSIYFVFRGSTGDKPYVAKVDYLRFKENVEDLNVKLEAEKSDENSGNGLKNESINLGGTYDGAWIKYNGVEFGENGVNTLQVRYSTRNDACATDARMEIREDSPEGELLGTVNMPLTTGWQDWQLSTVNLSKTISGTHNICFVLKGTTDTQRTYIANIDYMEFSNVDMQHFESESYNDWSGGELKVEESTDNQGKKLHNVGGARDGSWLSYDNVVFGGETEIKVRYSHNPGTAGPNSKIDLYLDNMDGNPVGTIDLPTTNGWSNYTYAKTTLKQPIQGTHTLYMVLHTGNSGWVANLDWFEVGKPGVIVDKTGLQEKYDQYAEILDLKDMYHGIGYNIFKNVMVDANAMLSDENASVEDVAIMIKNIDNSVNTLQYQVAFDLNDKVIESETVKEADYTSDSFAAYAQALENAKSLDKNSTFEEFENAYRALIDAHSKLTRLNRENLRLMIEKAEAIDLNQYQETGKAEFKKALANAKTVYETVSLTQAQVDEATDALDKAIQELQLIQETVSKDELKKLIDEVSGLDSSKYTKESWGAFEKALADAKAVLAKEDATQEEVNQAVAALIKAKAQLVPVKDEGNTGDEGDKPTPPEKPEVPEKPETPENKPDNGNGGNTKPENGEGGKEETSDNVNTGTAMQTTGLVAALAVSGIALVYAERKKHLHK